MSDRELAQLICALRITFPQLGIVLSTRERASLRDALVPLGVTMMSAGSHTEPGGYTRQGIDNLHMTGPRPDRGAGVRERCRPTGDRPVRDQR
jgi:2-iminoacetate synthase